MENGRISLVNIGPRYSIQHSADLLGKQKVLTMAHNLLIYLIIDKIFVIVAVM